jgi:type VI secretion system protein ImpJ
MSRYSRVSWKDGMFLLPQHFQQAERSLDAALDVRFGGHGALGWGVLKLQFKEAELETGMLELGRCRAILPDGLAVDVGEDAEPAPPARPIRMPATAQRIDVFLTVPRVRVGMPLVASDATRADARFIERSMETSDDHVPEQVQTIDVADKNLRLVITGEPLEGLEVLKLAEVERSPSGGYALRRDFIPPCPRIAGSPALAQLGNELLAMAAARLVELDRERRRGGGGEVNPAELQSFWFLQMLQMQVPVLRHLLDTPGTHPAQLFQELLRLTGGLVAFSPDGLHPAELPAYDHSALADCFGRLAERLRRLLGRTFQPRYEIIPLSLQGSIRVGTIPRQLLGDGGEFYLEVRGGSGDIDRLPQLAKIAEVDQIDTYLAKAYPGIRLEARPRPPPPVPVRGDARYFRLQAEGPIWQQVSTTGRIAIYVPGWLGGIEMELYGLAKEVAQEVRR